MDSINNQRDINIMTPEDTSELFRLGLLRRMEIEGITQADIAKAKIDGNPIVSKTHISRVLGEGSDYSIGTKLQRKIAAFLGKSVRGMINEGYQIKYGTSSPPDTAYMHSFVESSEDYDTPEDRRNPPSDSDILRLVSERLNQLSGKVAKAEEECLKWTSLFETLHDSYSIVGVDGTFRYQNRRSIELYGHHVGSHIDIAYREFDPGDNAKLKEVLNTGLEHHKKEWQEDRFMHVTYLPLFDAGGGVERVVLVGRDITESEIRKQETEDNLARFAGIFNSALMGLILVDENSKVIITNDAFKSLAQVKHVPETLSDMLEAAMTMQNATDVATRLMTSFKEHAPSEGICILPDGNKLWQDMRPLFNGEKFVGLICRLFDYDEKNGKRRFFRREDNS